MLADSCGEMLGKLQSVHRERCAGWYTAGIGGLQDHRAELTQLRFEQPMRCGQSISLERLAADQFHQERGLMCWRLPLRAHLVELHRQATAGNLIGRLSAGQTTTNDDHGEGLHRPPAPTSAGSAVSAVPCMASW